MQTSYFDIVDEYSIARVVTYAVDGARTHDAGVNTRDIQVLVLVSRRDEVVHLIQATANHCHRTMQALITYNKTDTAYKVPHSIN